MLGVEILGLLGGPGMPQQWKKEGFRVQVNLVSRLIMGMTRVTTWLVGITNLRTKFP